MNAIKVEVENLDKNKLRLTEHLGDGVLGKTKFKTYFTLPVRSLIVQIEEDRYFVDVQNVIQKVVEMHIKRTRVSKVK